MKLMPAKNQKSKNGNWIVMEKENIIPDSMGPGNANERRRGG
jgi:hypothetical protein